MTLENVEDRFKIGFRLSSMVCVTGLWMAIIG